MHTNVLGQEIRRLRHQAGFTLRGCAAILKISAAHLSDIERSLRRPSEKLLKAIAHELRAVGATVQAFDLLITGVDPETREWAASTPGVRNLLRALKESGMQPHEFLPILQKHIARKKGGKPVETK